MQLRHKLFLVLSLLTSVPLLILLFVVVERLQSEVQLRTENELHVSLNKLTDELQLIIDNQKSVAKGLAEVPVVQAFADMVNRSASGGGDPAEYRRRAEQLEKFFLDYQRSVPGIQALRFIDSRGKTLVKVKEGKPIQPDKLDSVFQRLYVADQSTKSFFRYSVESGGEDVVMSDFELGRVTYDADFCPAMVRYSTLIKDEVDQRHGLLVVNMWGTRLDSTVEAALGGSENQAYIVEINPGSERDGIFLYHRDSRKRFSNQLESDYRFTNEVSAQEWRTIKASAKQGSLFRDDGRMFFYRKISPFATRPNTQWLLLIEADSNHLFAPIKNMRYSIWLLLGIILIVSLGVSVWAAWRLTRPVQALANVIRRYADGDPTARYTESRRDEIGLAGKAFNYLRASLEKARQERDKAEQLARQSERLASVGQMAAGIGHEINNPLLNIMSLANLIEDSVKDKDPQALSDVQLLKKEGKRCAHIVQGILSFARENEPEYTDFDMAELIDQTLELLRYRIEAAEISIVRDLQTDLRINGDPNQLQQVLVNLLLNALQASPPGGTIELRARRGTDRITVEIVDTGSGIEHDFLNKVFDPFFTTKAEGEGTGLGLSVSYGIVKHHGGTIELENRTDSGLRVVIVLPLKAQAPASEEEYVMEAVNVG